MGPWPDALRVAIDDAWRVFDIPAPATTGVCIQCCMDPAIEADFLNVPARRLSPAFIRDWYDAAYGDQIEQDHVAWFLPRVLELLAAGETVAIVGNEVVFQRLPVTGFPDRWPQAQAAAVQAFAKAFLAAQVSGEIAPIPEGLDGCLCMFGEGGIDLAPLLGVLDSLDDMALVALLHRDWIKPFGRSIPGSPFWTGGPARNRVWDWYTSDAMLDRLTRAMLAGSEPAVDLYDLIVDARSDTAV